MELNKEYSLESFTIISELGKGSFSTVYLVKHIESLYVLKKIELKKITTSIDFEVNILKKLDNVHIVKYLTSFKTEEHLCIVMEYCEQGDLFSIMNNNKNTNLLLDELTLWNYAYQILLGLLYLHSKKIIHRDLKLQNIFINKDNVIKVGDFGLSKILTSSSRAVTNRVGTPLYLAPELVKKENYDYKIDIWSLGCTLYHLACQDVPFKGDGFRRLGYSIVNHVPKRLPDYYSDELNDFVMLLMNKTPELRPSCASVMKMIPNLVKEKYHLNITRLKEKKNFHGGDSVIKKSFSSKFFKLNGFSHTNTNFYSSVKNDMKSPSITQTRNFFKHIPLNKKKNKFQIGLVKNGGMTIRPATTEVVHLEGGDRHNQPQNQRLREIISNNNEKITSLCNQDVLDSPITQEEVIDDYLKPRLSSFLKISPIRKKSGKTKEEYRTERSMKPRTCTMLPKVSSKFTSFNVNRKESANFSHLKLSLDQLSLDKLIKCLKTSGTKCLTINDIE